MSDIEAERSGFTFWCERLRIPILEASWLLAAAEIEDGEELENYARCYLVFPLTLAHELELGRACRLRLVGAVRARELQAEVAAVAR